MDLTNETPEVINARMFDLARYMRSELFEAELITDKEYMFLMHECPLAQGSGSPSPRRLEAYDATVEKVKILRTTLRKIRRHPDATLNIKTMCVKSLRDSSNKLAGSESLSTAEESCATLWHIALFAKGNAVSEEEIRERLEFFYIPEVVETAYQFVKSYAVPE